MLQNTPKNERKDFGPKNSLSRRAGFHFAKNVPREGPKDAKETYQLIFSALLAEKMTPKWRIREKTGQKEQPVKRVRQENNKKPKIRKM